MHLLHTQSSHKLKRQFLVVSMFSASLSGCVVPSTTTSSSSSQTLSSSSVSSSSSSSAVTFDTATFVPDSSWACGVPEGLPPPEKGTLVFTATVMVGGSHEFGETPYGERVLNDISGATVTGSRIQGQFLTGGLDLELTLSNGATELEQINILRTSNGTAIYMRTCGFAPAGAEEIRFVPDFEAPNSSSYAWLNSGKYAGIRKFYKGARTMELEIYDISAVTQSFPKIQLDDPSGVPDQPWNCSMQTGGKGSTVLTETVTLGGSVSVGASKRGNRNIIPITGGNFSGRLSGTIVPGGADYQLTGTGAAVLDARYTLKTNDGEYILVRNCGPFGALVPWFETRKNTSYSFLNNNNFVSSDPGGFGGGGVTITFYERN